MALNRLKKHSLCCLGLVCCLIGAFCLLPVKSHANSNDAPYTYIFNLDYPGLEGDLSSHEEVFQGNPCPKIAKTCQTAVQNVQTYLNSCTSQDGKKCNTNKVSQALKKMNLPSPRQCLDTLKNHKTALRQLNSSYTQSRKLMRDLTGVRKRTVDLRGWHDLFNFEAATRMQAQLNARRQHTKAYTQSLQTLQAMYSRQSMQGENNLHGQVAKLQEALLDHWQEVTALNAETQAPPKKANKVRNLVLNMGACRTTTADFSRLFRMNTSLIKGLEKKQSAEERAYHAVITLVRLCRDGSKDNENGKASFEEMKHLAWQLADKTKNAGAPKLEEAKLKPLTKEFEQEQFAKIKARHQDALVLLKSRNWGGSRSVPTGAFSCSGFFIQQANQPPKLLTGSHCAETLPGSHTSVQYATTTDIVQNYTIDMKLLDTKTINLRHHDYLFANAPLNAYFADNANVVNYTKGTDMMAIRVKEKHPSISPIKRIKSPSDSIERGAPHVVYGHPAENGHRPAMQMIRFDGWDADFFESKGYIARFSATPGNRKRFSGFSGAPVFTADNQNAVSFIFTHENQNKKQVYASPIFMVDTESGSVVRNHPPVKNLEEIGDKEVRVLRKKCSDVENKLYFCTTYYSRKQGYRYVKEPYQP